MHSLFKDTRDSNYIPRPPRNILVIGDSISKNYAPHLKGILSADNVFCAADDEWRSSFAEQNIERRIAECGVTPDIVIWNSGLCDCRIPVTSALDYAANLRSTVEKIKLRGIKRVAFTTTIRILPAATYDSEHVTTLNSIARQLLPELGVEIVDLHLVSLQFDAYNFTDCNTSQGISLACAIAMNLAI